MTTAPLASGVTTHLARLPGEVEVSSRGHGHVGSVGRAVDVSERAGVVGGPADAAADGAVESGGDGLLHSSTPVVTEGG